ncbi:STAS domain-containing protein [Mycobacterium sp. NPDC003323]
MSSQPDPAPSRAAAVGEVEERRVGDISVVAVAGTVDMLTAPKLEAAINAAAKSSPAAVVVDFTAVEFLASAGMGVLVAAHGDLAPAVRLAVVADGPATSRPLKLVGIADIVDLFATLDEALAELQS